MLFIKWYRPSTGVFWQEPSLVYPWQVLHYGSCCFEGMKAYKDKDQHLRLFRPDMNMDRLSRSAACLTLPEFDKVDCWSLCHFFALVSLDIPRAQSICMTTDLPCANCASHLFVSSGLCTPYPLLPLQPPGVFIGEESKSNPDMCSNSWFGIGWICCIESHCSTLHLSNPQKSKLYMFFLHNYTLLQFTRVTSISR
jgi:hypothetical protein